ncbi:MAG: Ig-like domain-containing protein, partial [Bacteroidota bacterium]
MNKITQKVKSKRKYYVFSMLFLINLISSQMSWGQSKQLTGTYPVMDGGFEGQTIGALGSTLSATVWTRASSVTASIGNASGTARSGDNCLSYSIVSGGRYVQSPYIAPLLSSSTDYIVQFYYKSATGPTTYLNGALNPAGANIIAPVALSPSFTANTWLRASVKITTSATAVTSTNWAGLRDGSSSPVVGAAAIIDDYVIYAGSVIDVTAPDPATAPLAVVNGAALDISWTAPVTGVDLGGYMVVRYDVAPNADNDPNVNGIYALNNTITNGTSTLSGKVVYVGTATSFQDATVVSSTNYYYKIYTVDKAFNYSTEVGITGNAVAANVAPVAVADAITVAEGGIATTLTGTVSSVLTNDTDAENNTLTAVVVANPTNGSLTLNADGTFSYTHNGSETTTDSFTYKANDGTSDSNIVTVSISITSVNDTPVAVADVITVPEGGAANTLTGGAASVLVNDTDAENNTLTAIVVANPTNGTLTLNSNGTFSYTHNGSETTTDSFTYKANDGISDSNTVTVSISITAVNDAPVGVADAISVPKGGTATTLIGGVTSVVANDTDAENNTLSAIVVANPTNGTLTLNTNGTFSYVHDGTNTTTDSFTYKTNDGTSDSNIVTVSISITAANDAPVAVADVMTVAEGGTAIALTGGAISVLVNDTDTENNTLTAAVVANPTNGTLTLNSNGTFSYVHNGSETTTDSFTYKANDGISNSNTVTVSISITPVNDAPVAITDAITVAGGGTATTLTGGATSVLANDTDAENNSLTAVLVTGPTNGSLTLNANGTFSYVHNGSATTSDSFTYKANDGTTNSNTVTVNITIASTLSPTGLSYTTPNVFTKGTAITALNPTVSGGAVVSYGVSPSLPTGLSLDITTGVISGTPSTVSVASNYVVTATNTGGSTNATVSIAVKDVAPSALSYTTPNVFTKGTAITALNPTVSGGAVVSYSVSPSLPTGLSLNTTTGIISGTPSVVSVASNYVVTATNTGGSINATVSIAVKDIAPSALSYTTPNVFTKGTAITALNPTVSGGAVVSYSVSPSLPTGLSLNT